MQYTVQDLITLFRREVEDPSYVGDRNMPSINSFWSNYELIQYLNQGQLEFAERTLVFKDSSTYKGTITDGDPWIDYDPKIIHIERAELESNNVLLPILTIEEFQTKATFRDYVVVKPSSWEVRTGNPLYLISDIELGKLRVYPIPVNDDTVDLTVRRLPLNDLVEMDDLIEIPERWQYGLLKKLKAEAFKNPKAMAAGFGELVTLSRNEWDDFLNYADSRINIRTRSPGKVRYGGL